MTECKHGLRSGCCYCHARTEVGRLNVPRSGRRTNRVIGYAAKVAAAMNREGPLAVDWQPQYRTIKRSVARFQVGYGGN